MSNPIRIQGFDHIVLRIADKSATLAFYEGVLGLKVDRDRPDLGLTHIRAGAQMIDLVTVDGIIGRLGGAGPAVEGRNLDHFALHIEPFDEAAIRAHLASLGIEAGPIASRYGAEGEGPSIYLSDPQGNVVELKGPPDA